MEPVKKLVVTILNRTTVRYIRRNHIMVIGVAGSLGKTSTASAIRTVLAQHYTVHQPATTYNTNRSIHLEMFDMNFVSNPLAWAWMVLRVLLKSLGKADYEVLVVEMGTDYPGELQSFAFLKPQIGVLTAIAPEHMERFKTIEAVAKEELAMAEFCEKLVFNADMVAKKFVPSECADRIIWYGADTEYRAENYRVETGPADTIAVGNATATADTVGVALPKVKASFTALGKPLGDVELQVLGKHSLGALTAAMAVGLQCDLDRKELVVGLQAVRPVKGRMQRLAGVVGSTILDDSYNASPDSMKAALDVLYGIDAPQRIAVLGMMNEMGDHSPEMHRQVGDYCDPTRLAMVVTVGADANTYLAAQAEERGCVVKRFANPYDAGVYVREQIKPGAILLFKGSQNGVFTEEAIKPVLADESDQERLVRQSDYWLKRKRQQFGITE